jgi:hypothetical protein
VNGYAYQNAVELAASETGLPAATFPKDYPLTVEQLLAINMSNDDTA